MISVNTRVLHGKTTGVQRYLLEILSIINSKVNTIAPHSQSAGMAGHLWEQTLLPLKLKNSPLWSPAATGPIFYKNQIVTIHDVSVLDHPEWFSPKFSKWYGFILPKVCQVSKHIITDSHFSKERIVQKCGVPESKISVVYLGCSSLSETSKETSSTLNSIPFKKYFLVVGSLEPRKNLHRLLMAWKTIQHKLPEDFGLVFVGGSGNSQIFADSKIEVGPEDRIHFTGYASDSVLDDLYRNCFAFIYPSLYEGFGLPPLEAMSRGAPVLTSNTTALGEIAGQSALTFDPSDDTDMGDKIFKIACDENLRLDLVRKSLEFSAKFDWKKTAEETYNILEQHLL